jgi:hypothetical protein
MKGATCRRPILPPRQQEGLQVILRPGPTPVLNAAAWKYFNCPEEAGGYAEPYNSSYRRDEKCVESQEIIRTRPNRDGPGESRVEGIWRSR